MSQIPFVMLFGPFKHPTTRGEITVQGLCSLSIKHADLQKGTVSSMSTHISIDINTDKENFHKTWDFTKFMTDRECLGFVFEQITKFEETGKLL